MFIASQLHKLRVETDKWIASRHWQQIEALAAARAAAPAIVSGECRLPAFTRLLVGLHSGRVFAGLSMLTTTQSGGAFDSPRTRAAG